ncbi:MULTISPECIES: DUF2919 family protein [Thiorhodovibrio]|uniref:DUF2919 family protein n=1 Tax=Thiorhodovibrio TaxID=61593 RepID=UPI0019138088|nr:MULTISPECIES: DUF2919 family protein [Thiorhodovibrio]MBK5969795.1 hypothetical protein [Thiorhodovibrio winogradskyi]WPL12161.1 hypothetical protein Thiosp_01917 [Thiorhodovibrio litoralis]
MHSPPAINRLPYPPERYDAELNLRIPATLWLIMALLLRHGLLLIITFMPTTGKEITVLRELILPKYLLADAIALPVFISAIRRHASKRPAWMPAVWRRARALLSLSILLYIGLLASSLFAASGPLEQRLTQPVLISALLNFAGLTYLWRSRLLPDLCRDWPDTK